MFKSITLPQVLGLAVMLGFTFAAYKFLGENAAAAMGAATVAISFLMGRGEDKAGAQ